MTKILAIDTATDACSVAVFINGEIVEDFSFIPRLHSQQLLPKVEQLLAKCQASVQDMDAIAFGCGPGSFTGIRIATAVAQGLAFAANLPVVPVSTLAAVSQFAIRKYNANRVFASLDARLHEIYWGTYQACEGIAVFCSEVIPQEQVGAPEQIAQIMSSINVSDWIGAGNGWRYYERLNVGLSNYYADIYPHAHDIALLACRSVEKGEVLAPDEAMPSYVRNDVVRNA